MTYTTQTRVLVVDPQHPEAEVIRTAAATIREGRLVAFPTETVYGLGANALDSAAIARIFQAKQRPTTDPIIAHIAAPSQLNELAVNIPPKAFALAQAFFPGPLTLILQRAPHVPENIAAGLNTIAVRMPAHPVAQALIQAADVPIAAPSANTFTRPSATTAQHVLEDLHGHVDIVLDGGATTIGLESTVLDMTQSVPVVLRPGGLLLDDLRALIPDIQFAPRFVKEETAASSPGQMLKHYAPRAAVTVFTGERRAVLQAMQLAALEHLQTGKQVGVLVADEDRSLFDPRVVVRSLGADLHEIGRNLFAGLREVDARGVDVILVRDFGREGLGAALWDRLVRAAQGNIINMN